jgi:leucyl-tRNA synthetase
VWKLKSKLQIKSKKFPQLVHSTIKKVSEDIENFKFNTAISALMILVNALEKEEGMEREHYETLLQLLAPFAPHLAEELWHELGHESSIHREPWPTYDERLLGGERRVVVQIDGKIRATFECTEELDEKTALSRARALPTVARHLEGKTIRRSIYVPGRLLNIVLER